jgi:predicted CoA-binding protein
VSWLWCYAAFGCQILYFVLNLSSYNKLILFPTSPAIKIETQLEQQVENSLVHVAEQPDLVQIKAKPEEVQRKTDLKNN